MAIRSGMIKLEDKLRTMTNATQDEYQIGQKWYWDADDLQDILDKHRTDVWRETLYAQQTYLGGSVVYTNYYSQHGNYENVASGTAYFYLEDGSNNVVGTANYTPDYYRGHVLFSADTGGSTIYLTGRSFDLNAAAAEVWRRKAAHYANMFDFSTDNHSVKRSQMMKQALDMAGYYESLGGPKQMQVERDDTL